MNGLTVSVKGVILNEGAFMNNLVRYYAEVMEQAQEEFAEKMEDEARKTVHGRGPGKPYWRLNVARNIDLVDAKVTDTSIEATVGVRPDTIESESELVRAMVVEAGAGSAVGNPPIRSKPGEQVWDNNLSGKKTSTAKTAYDLPSAFNQEGNHFVENATKEFEKRFQDIFADAGNNVPSWVYSNVVSTR